MFLKARRHLSKLKALIATALLLALPFFGNMQHVSALQMSHDHATGVSCVTACARAGSTPPQQIILNQEEVRAPDPTPYDDQAYYSQSQFPSLRKAPKPQEIFGLASFRPPDLVTLYANFRL